MKKNLKEIWEDDSQITPTADDEGRLLKTKRNSMRSRLRGYGCKVPFASIFVFKCKDVPSSVKGEAIDLGFKFITQG